MVELIPLPEAGPSAAVVTRCCTKCGEAKADGDFYFRNKRLSRKRHSWCKTCHIGPLMGKGSNPIPWAKRPENKDRIALAQARSRKKHRISRMAKSRIAGSLYYYRNREAILAANKVKYYANREAEIKKSTAWKKRHPHVVRAWLDSNRDKISAYNKSFSARHPKHHLKYRHNRRARKLANGGKITAGIWMKRMSEQNGLCVYCNKDISGGGYHLDHIIPLKLGGMNSDSNIQLTCARCNLSKHDKHPLDFAAKMGIIRNPIYVAI